MKLSLLNISAILLMSFNSINPIWADDYDFRKTKWGMSKDEVLLSEKNLEYNIKKGELEGEITIVTELLNRTVVGSYTFINNKLVIGDYHYMGGKERDATKADYEDFKKLLIEQYGNPLNEKILSLPYECHWEIDTTKIYLSFFEIPYIGYHACEIEYTGKQFLSLIQKKNMEEKAQDKENLMELIASSFKDKIKIFCEDEWPDDYRMQRYCINEQIEAVKKLLLLIDNAPSDIPTDVYNKIAQKCAKEWDVNYKMQLYCRNKQVDAWREINQ